jgi:serine/threonine protein kinase
LYIYIKLNYTNLFNFRLKRIHDVNFTHRDIHSGNILRLEPNLKKSFQIADLGLAQPENIPNEEIYGVLPYIAPEIFKGCKFSKSSDVYSMGMIIWEITTGRKPFDDVEHDITLIFEIIDGKRPIITEDTPECIASLMKRCWDPYPENRPSMDEINKILSNLKNEEFKEAEQKRLELIGLKKLGPEFIEKPNSKAVYTRRSLSLYSENLSLMNQDNQGM